MSFFFFNDTATTEIYTLSLHDALPIWPAVVHPEVVPDLDEAGLGVHLGYADVRPEREGEVGWVEEDLLAQQDRKSTRLNSSHANISYAVFCLKKKTGL